MKGWIEKTDDRESVDDSELNDLTLTALEISKKKRLLVFPLLRLHVRA